MACSQPQRRCRRQDQRPWTQAHQRVVVVLLLVEPVTPDVPLLDGVELVEPDEPVPVAPIELVLPVVPLLPVVVSELVLPEVELGLVLLEPVVVDGVVVVLLEELVEPGPAPVVSRLLHALRERAATTARTAAVAWVRDVFIRKLLGWL
jgi:hypothetical protein